MIMNSKWFSRLITVQSFLPLILLTIRYLVDLTRNKTLDEEPIRITSCEKIMKRLYFEHLVRSRLLERLQSVSKQVSLTEEAHAKTQIKRTQNQNERKKVAELKQLQLQRGGTGVTRDKKTWFKNETTTSVAPIENITVQRKVIYQKKRPKTHFRKTQKPGRV